MSDSEITDTYASLTKHPEGSMRELFAISFPLMLSILSGNLMMFLDRLILANYSLEAMNAAAAAGVVAMVFQYGAIGIASIAEVFVGQRNGAKRFSKAADPTWQMVWFALFSSVIFLFAAIYGAPYFLADYHYEEHARPYYQWILYFGPFFPLQAAFSAFFIGIGRVKIVTIAAIIGNIANILLDLLLVFGYSDFIPSMGTKGAAIATGISQGVQLAILLIPFFSSQIKEKYNTLNFSFQSKLFAKCLRVGTPTAFGHMIEISAWAFLMQLVAGVSENHLTVFAVGQSFYPLISFVMEGLQKGVTTVSANFIGAKKWDKVSKTFRSAVKLLFCLGLITSLFMLVYPDPLIWEFLSKEAPPAEALEVFTMIRYSCVFIWLYFLLDGLTWISAGVITAAGDTLFVMITNLITAWLFAVLPVYLIVVRGGASPVYGWALVCMYAAANAILFFTRYKLGGWKNREALH